MGSIISTLSRLTLSGLATAAVLLTSLTFSLALTMSGTFAAGVSGMLGSLGVRTAFETVTLQRDAARRGLATASADNRRLKKHMAAHRQLVKRVNGRVFARTLRSTARSVSAIGLESLPVIGVAALVGTTAWEVHDGCATLADLHELYTAFGIEPDYPDYQLSCIRYTERVDALKGQATDLFSLPE